MSCCVSEVIVVLRGVLKSTATSTPNAIGHAVAETGSCRVKVRVYDGRRRYDLVLAEDGVERLTSSERGTTAALERRALDMVRLAGFSSERDRAPPPDHRTPCTLPV